MPKTPSFTPALFTFLSELRLHNDREWFARNKDRYVRDVRDPMLRFIADFAPVLKKLAPRLVADPRPVGGSMFRIQRDTRFANDKTPYKTNAAAHFRHEAGRDVHGPAFYLSLDPEEVDVGGGIWHPEAEPLLAIRKAIVARPAAWKRAVAAPGMKKVVWWGERLKRMPRGFPEEHPLGEFLRQKDFACGLVLTEKDACAPRFPERVAETYRAMLPAMKFLAGAVELAW